MDHIRFNAGDMTLIIACALGAVPSILYWGARLSDDSNIEDVIALQKQYGVAGSEDNIITASIAMELGLGYAAPSGLEAHKEGRDWGHIFTVISATQSDDAAHIICRDGDISLSYAISVDPITGLMQLCSAIKNEGDDVLTLNSMATAVLPIPYAMTDIIGFSGRWANEFQRERVKRFSGSYVRENRRGRTSHDSFPAIILASAETNEQSGEAYGLHLAWSGNHKIRVDTLMDGRIFASMGASSLPSEIRLCSGETYQSPAIVAGYSGAGLSALSRQFHAHVQDKLIRPSAPNRPRRVHYNSWEALYFDHDEDALKSMADKAAAIGIERFVLDDGWFGSRRSDKSGLGDWVVSDDIYPNGLKPLIDHVTNLGMEMGIWFEPEMVNPDSDLFRAHPDWILQIKDKDQVPFRNQYVLDIARPEVAEYLFGQIDAVLRDHDIGYVKWDMNRDLNHPAAKGGAAIGQARAHAHVIALYGLLERIRKAHPEVEIESCSSGGGRADYGILAHTDRIWTSDNNDALERQNIQKGASYFLPLSLIGSHVGPAKCHITGRSLSMAMRCASAIMGHMGAELNLLEEPPEDLAALKDAIALYKKHRTLIHSGDHYRIDTPEYLNIMGVVSKDQNQALYSVAYIEAMPSNQAIRIKFAGLDADADYALSAIWPAHHNLSTHYHQKDMLISGLGGIYKGELLQKIGLQLPPSYPETAMIFHLIRQ